MFRRPFACRPISDTSPDRERRTDLGATTRLFRLRERAVRMVAEVRGQHETEWAAMRAVSELLGVSTTTAPERPPIHGDRACTGQCGFGRAAPLQTIR